MTVHRLALVFLTVGALLTMAAACDYWLSVRAGPGVSIEETERVFVGSRAGETIKVAYVLRNSRRLDATVLGLTHC